jgi:hypothetical protein
MYDQAYALGAKIVFWPSMMSTPDRDAISAARVFKYHVVANGSPGTVLDSTGRQVRTIPIKLSTEGISPIELSQLTPLIRTRAGGGLPCNHAQHYRRWRLDWNDRPRRDLGAREPPRCAAGENSDKSINCDMFR